MFDNFVGFFVSSMCRSPTATGDSYWIRWSSLELSASVGDLGVTSCFCSWKCNLWIFEHCCCLVSLQGHCRQRWLNTNSMQILVITIPSCLLPSSYSLRGGGGVLNPNIINLFTGSSAASSAGPADGTSGSLSEVMTGLHPLPHLPFASWSVPITS